MGLIKLDNLPKLNIPEIDSQHETMVGLINSLDETMLQGIDGAPLEVLLSQLLEEARAHFSCEEQLMSQNNYPGYEAHKAEHTRLRQQLVGLVERYKNDELLLSFTVVAELRDWAENHIENSDKQLGAFLDKQKKADAEPD